MSPITTIHEKSKEARSYLSAQHDHPGAPIFEMLLLEETRP